MLRPFGSQYNTRNHFGGGTLPRKVSDPSTSEWMPLPHQGDQEVLPVYILHYLWSGPSNNRKDWFSSNTSYGMGLFLFGDMMEGRDKDLSFVVEDIVRD